MSDYTRTLSFLVFVLALSFNLVAQGNSIESVLRNADGEAIPFAHIYLTKSTGTIANANGEFRLYIPSGTSPGQLLTVTAIGYQTRKIEIRNIPSIILMAEDQQMLREVVVLPVDYARRLIREAIEKIPENYPSFEEHHIGFLREQTSWKSDEDRLLYVVEANLESTKNSYQKTSRSGDVKVLKSRRYNTNGLDSIFFKIIAGTHHTHRFDEVAKRDLFLKNDHSYDFEIVDTLRNQGENVIKITFKHKNESPNGNVFIEESSRAFVRFEIDYDSNFPVFYRDRGRIYFEFNTDYFKAEDSLWRFLKSDYQTFFKKNGDTLILKSSFITTSHQKDASKIPYPEQFQRSSSVLEKVEIYDSAFWKNFNILLPDPTIEKAFKRGSPQGTGISTPEALSKKEKFFKILSRLQLSYGAHFSGVDVSPHSTVYSNGSLSIAENEQAIDNQIAFSLSSSITYEVTPKLFIGYSNESPLNQRGITSHDFLALAAFNVNPKARPILLMPSLRMGHQQINALLDAYHSDGSFEVNGTTFDSEKTELFLSQRNVRIQPGLRIGIEKSRRTTFFLGANYDLPIHGKHGLFFREVNEFFLFRKTQFLETGNEGLNMETSDDLLKSDLSMELGILIGF